LQAKEAARRFRLIVNGAASGCIYGLIALGCVLIYNATETVNFAQGDIMMMGAFVALTLIAHWGVNFSRELMGQPKLLLLDEPSLGLSPLLVQHIFGIIRRINKEQGVAILLVEQNAHIALKTADYGYIIEAGRIVAQDSCAALLQRDDIKEFYLGQKETGERGQRRWKRKWLWN